MGVADARNARRARDPEDVDDRVIVSASAAKQSSHTTHSKAVATDDSRQPESTPLRLLFRRGEGGVCRASVRAIEIRPLAQVSIAAVGTPARIAKEKPA